MKEKIDISNQYNSITIEYSKNNKETTKKLLIELVNKKDQHIHHYLCFL